MPTQISVKGVLTDITVFGTVKTSDCTVGAIVGSVQKRLMSAFNHEFQCLGLELDVAMCSTFVLPGMLAL